MKQDDLTSEHLINQWLERSLPNDSRKWWSETRSALEKDSSDGPLNLAVSLVIRKVEKDDLVLNAADFALAEVTRRGWEPVEWTLDQAARISFLLVAGRTSENFPSQLESLFRTADIGESVAFYRGLPLYPSPQSYAGRAAEGIRSNMKAVFNAVAHRNPYPKDSLSEGAWNQMVLKALFIESPLHLIRGLDERANEPLRDMLLDYAHERWAAGRKVSPELWRCVGLKANQRALEDLERALKTGDDMEKKAATLALRSSSLKDAKDLLARYSNDSISEGLDWAQLLSN